MTVATAAYTAGTAVARQGVPRPSRPCLLAALVVPALVAGAALPAGPPPAAVRAGPIRLPHDRGWKQNLQWSPDGKRFLMTRIHKGKMGLWVMNAEGTGLRLLLAPTPATPHFDGHWSPDGK